MAGPTIVTNGDEQLKQRLRRTFTGEDVGALRARCRSDLAGLACRVVRDGDEWVITGQKV